MNTLTQLIVEEGKNQATSLGQSAATAATTHTTTLWTNLTSINPWIAILLIILAIYITYWFIITIKWLLKVAVVLLGAATLLTAAFYLVTK